MGITGITKNFHTAPSDNNNTAVVDSSSVCIFPNCKSHKFTEADGTIHPYCGKTHAQLAKQLGIFRKPNIKSKTISFTVITLNTEKQQQQVNLRISVSWKVVQEQGVKKAPKLMNTAVQIMQERMVLIEVCNIGLDDVSILMSIL